MVSNSPRAQGLQKAAETTIFLALHKKKIIQPLNKHKPRKKKNHFFYSTVRGDKYMVVGV